MADEVRASDILSYKGDAALAAGSDPNSIVEFGAGGAGRDPLGGVNQLLGNVMDHQIRWNAMQYQQAVKDRDSLQETFASQDIDFPVEDVDRPVLQAQIDKIKDKMIATPNLKSNREAYMDVQKEITKLTAMKASAKTRAAQATLQRKAAADTLNPVEKESRIKSLDEQLKKGVEHQVDPFNQELTYDPKDLAAPEPLTTYEAAPDKDGIPYRLTVTQPNPRAYTDEISMEGVLTGPKMDKPYKVKKFFDQQSQNPDLINPESVQKMNAVIDAFNAENKYDPSSRYYAKHIAEVQDGQPVITVSPMDFWKSFKVASTWSAPTKTLAIDEDRQKALETKMKIGTGYQDATSRTITAKAAMKRANTDASLAPAQIELYKANAENARANGDATRYDTEIKKSEAGQQVNNSVQLFGNEAKATDYKDYKKDLALNVQLNAMPEFGYGTDWLVKDLGKKNETALKALSVGQYYKPDGTPLPQGQFAEGATLRIVTPSRIIMVKSPDGDPNKMRLVGLSANGNVMGVLDPNQAVERLIYDASGYKNDKEYVDKTSAARRVIQDIQGSNASGMDLSVIMNRQPIVDNIPGGEPTANENLTLPDGTKLIRQGDNILDPVTLKVVGKLDASGGFHNVE